jgi:hypothetical protein
VRARPVDRTAGGPPGLDDRFELELDQALLGDGGTAAPERGVVPADVGGQDEPGAVRQPGRGADRRRFEVVVRQQLDHRGVVAVHRGVAGDGLEVDEVDAVVAGPGGDLGDGEEAAVGREPARSGPPAGREDAALLTGRRSRTQVSKATPSPRLVA